jgi:ATP-binding cassette subfamily D (ALD) protein 3
LQGYNTIITGPNGCGKSSLFRVLGGLWPLRAGSIKKPGGSEHGLHKDIFYLPQKPYNVIGTLREQLIYPDHKQTMDDNSLYELLCKFGIGYLSTRYKEGFDSVQDWDMLSRGEQQRLAVARLFYHEPRYAILDECTSCMNKDAETMLYDSCRERNITCITISHRPALDQFHAYRLIFDGERGWRYERITDEESGEGRIGEIIREG